MPKIQWTGLPPALRDHLFDRLRERRITAEDLYQLKLWRESEPDAPDGLWYRDFSSFKICGEGKHPKTFLLARELVRRGDLPKSAIVDAFHIAIAAAHGMDYLLSWNCKHIANAAMRGRIEATCRSHEVEPPTICTPFELAME